MNVLWRCLEQSCRTPPEVLFNIQPMPEHSICPSWNRVEKAAHLLLGNEFPGILLNQQSLPIQWTIMTRNLAREQCLEHTNRVWFVITSTSKNGHYLCAQKEKICMQKLLNGHICFLVFFSERANAGYFLRWMWWQTMIYQCIDKY